MVRSLVWLVTLRRLRERVTRCATRAKRDSVARKLPESAVRLGVASGRSLPHGIGDESDPPHAASHGWRAQMARSVIVVPRHLSERRPRRARGDVLAVATAASEMRADIGHREGGSELADEHLDREDGVMPATVAPAEDVDVLMLELAKDRRMTPLLLRGEAVLFQSAHVIRLPVESFQTRKEHNKNIFRASSSRATVRGRSRPAGTDAANRSRGTCR